MGNHFGFRKGIATEDAIFKLTNEILKYLNNKAMAGSIFCDLEKAFNCVNHLNHLNDLIMESVVRLNYFLNLIFKIHVKEFKSLACILILTQSQNGPK